MKYICLYTKHKTQKSKTWQDGILDVQDTRVVLKSESGEVLDECHRPTVSAGDSFEFPRYLCSVESVNDAAVEVVAPPVVKKSRVEPLHTVKPSTAYVKPATVPKPVPQAPVVVSSAPVVCWMPLLPPIRRTLQQSVEFVQDTPMVNEPAEQPGDQQCDQFEPPPIDVPRSNEDDILMAFIASRDDQADKFDEAPEVDMQEVVEPPEIDIQEPVPAPVQEPQPVVKCDPRIPRTDILYIPPLNQLLVKGLTPSLIGPIPDTGPADDYIASLIQVSIEHQNADMLDRLTDAAKLMLEYNTDAIRSAWTSKLWTAGGAADAKPHCEHDIPCMIGTCRNGANAGRKFYGCSMKKPKQCKFFRWADAKTGGVAQLIEAKQLNELPLDVTKQLVSLSEHMYSKSYIDYYGNCVASKGYGITADTLNNNVLCSMSAGKLSGQIIYIKDRVTQGAGQEELMAMIGNENYFCKILAETFCAPVQEEKENPYFLLQLPHVRAPSHYSRGDLWIISSSPLFTTNSFIARSVYHSYITRDGKHIMGLIPISMAPKSVLDMSRVSAIRLGGSSSFLSEVPQLCRSLVDMILHQNEVQLLNQISVSVPHTTPPAVPHYDKANALIAEKSFKLNDDQRQVIDTVLSSNSITVVHGVFGCGKSQTLVSLVYLLHHLTELSVLVTAATNCAVDRILVSLVEIGMTDFLRIGSVRKINKKILPFTIHQGDANDEDDQGNTLAELQAMLKDNKLSKEDRQDITAAISKIESEGGKERRTNANDCRVIGATLASTGFAALSGRKFDLVILDEASQVTEPSAIMPVLRFNPHSLVLVGDPMQLQPVICRTCTPGGISRTMFERLAEAGHKPIILHAQYRLHPVISMLPNKLFYNGIIIDGVQALNPLLPNLPVLAAVDVESTAKSDQSKSMENAGEANACASIVNNLVRAGVTPDNIGVICLYRAQVNAVRKLIPDESVLIATVDSFQGGERDCIILSCVKTRISDEDQFVDNARRLNVALTRGKRHLFIVGHLHMLANTATWTKLLDLIEIKMPFQEFDKLVKKSVCMALSASYKSTLV